MNGGFDSDYLEQKLQDSFSTIRKTINNLFFNLNQR